MKRFIALLKISPVQLLLGRFGYVKIPLEVVRLSMNLEAFLKTINNYAEDEHGLDPFRKQIEAQHSLTEFLRAGRALKVITAE